MSAEKGTTATDESDAATTTNHISITKGTQTSITESAGSLNEIEIPTDHPVEESPKDINSTTTEQYQFVPPTSAAYDAMRFPTKQGTGGNIYMAITTTTIKPDADTTSRPIVYEHLQ